MGHAHPAIQSVSFETATNTLYDAVIVGGGISGAILAKELTLKGHSVLVMEAGPDTGLSYKGFKEYVTNYYSAASKDNNAPYPENPNAPMPRSTAVHKLVPGQADDRDYLVQNGPLAMDSTYTRVAGGTTMHWEAKILRMLPEDFSIRTRFNVGIDWPLNYDDLMPYYRKAEFEIGVSANIDTQHFGGLHYEPGYVYPMTGLPASFLDQAVASGIEGTTVNTGEEEKEISIRPFPQGRNSIPNPLYDNGKGYTPRGSVSAHQVDQGGRCQGNNNCVPICPVQAKYDARRTLLDAANTGRMDFIAKTVASEVLTDKTTGEVTHIRVKHYDDPKNPKCVDGVVRGKLFILAANAVENARLMLASDLPSSSGLMGKNLMDHTYLLAWGLLPTPAGTMRGTKVTSGIADFRYGQFRKHKAPFSIDIHNDGWGWATGSPFTDIEQLVDNENKFGAELREATVNRISNQLLFAYQVEQPADPANRITVDPKYTDALGNPKPVISYNLSDYSKAGIAFARQTSKLFFQRLGAEDFSHYPTSDYSYFTYEGEGYYFRGGNHFAGTHIMGTDAKTSVVNTEQRSWDHPNLFIVGSGSMPSIGTSNTTLTLAALCYISAEAAHEMLSESPINLKVGS